MTSDTEYKEFVEFMGGRVPNPEQYPLQFEYAVRNFLFIKKYEKPRTPTTTSFQGG